jgi:hypothetical protein
MKVVAVKKGVGKVFEVGEVVLVPLAIVVKTGLLKQWYSYHKLTRVVFKGNNIELLGLQEAYLGWGLMKVGVM